jgi:hypothetical protein
MAYKVVSKLKRATEARPAVARRQAGPAAGPARAPVIIEVDADGKRVRLTAKDEIVLACGKASITLRRNGRVVVRGTHVETNSEGMNRIKGGQVAIN